MRPGLKTIGGVTLQLPDLWEDISDLGDSDDGPFTLADPDDGYGVVQFSPALYRGGRMPEVSEEHLNQMLCEFESRMELGERLESSSGARSDGNTYVAASYRAGEDFVQVWYLSDSVSVLLITYVCEWQWRERERADREAVVASMRIVGESGSA